MAEQDFWRIDNWHPLSVHFPVAFLSFATILFVVALILKGDKELFLKNCGAFLLYTGSVAAWISIYTGDISESAVARKICDPTVLKAHEIAAYTMAYFFSAASILNLMLHFNILTGKLVLLLRYMVVLLMLAGTGYLVYVGHLGSSLVYDQGADVKNHVVDCGE
ncbi:DUF2231 domain-containing protein [Daejeonella sp.]|uniref:DUF2231 domain-containing protein n=1 Tax=Daejeonella sp. TaxID=2805397 RepID=UPI00271C6D83|nr:DUF2231 domain-containing protein [Daejeonella sp.]MDO8993079.1 hypothetical protein [Daejeonella sp.]MDP2412953.1 hypothetical protein [Daejeonella sp.]